MTYSKHHVVPPAVHFWVQREAARQLLPELRAQRKELAEAVKGIEGKCGELRKCCAEAEREGREDFEAVLNREKDVRLRLIKGLAAQPLEAKAVGRNPSQELVPHADRPPSYAKLSSPTGERSWFAVTVPAMHCSPKVLAVGTGTLGRYVRPVGLCWPLLGRERLPL
eukprot:Skav213772  [mRNA]  locus=scaffold3228:35821:39136:+ [translate_table: standard]